LNEWVQWWNWYGPLARYIFAHHFCEQFQPKFGSVNVFVAQTFPLFLTMHFFQFVGVCIWFICNRSLLANKWCWCKLSSTTGRCMNFLSVFTHSRIVTAFDLFLMMPSLFRSFVDYGHGLILTLFSQYLQVVILDSGCQVRQEMQLQRIFRLISSLSLT
jgi:hypothetical protein